MKPYEPHAKMHTAKKHMIVKISPEVVFLHSGKSYASSSDNVDKTICHTGSIFMVPSKIGCLCLQCEKHVGVQNWTSPQLFLTLGALVKNQNINENLMNHMREHILERSS